MSNVIDTDARPQERGAISIKTLLGLVLVAVVVLVLIKITPVYIDERQIIYKVDDLANKSAVRNSKEDDINKAIAVIKKEYELPEDSINLVSRETGKVQISVSYQRNIDFLVTTYQWKVDHKAAGKDL